MNPLKKFKEEQKELAQTIRTNKTWRRKSIWDKLEAGEIESKPDCVHNQQSAHTRSKMNSHKYRINHIAYCEVRGKSRDQIENPSEENKIDSYHENKINEIKAKLISDLEAYYAAKNT